MLNYKVTEPEKRSVPKKRGLPQRRFSHKIKGTAAKQPPPKDNTQKIDLKRKQDCSL